MNTFTKTVIAAFAALIMVLVPIVITDDGGDAAPSGNVPEEYEVWSTPIWSYTLEYAYRGQYVTEIPIWDFDDGTEPVQSWSGKHTYTDVGTYYIKQTSTNNVTSIDAYFQVQIMGFPYITLVYNNGEDNATIETERYADPASLYKPEADPERTGYDFTGWYTDEDCTEAFDWETEVEEPITLYAGWELSDIQYTVTFDVNGGSVEMDPVSVQNGSSYTIPVYEGVKEGSTFGGWSYNGQTYLNPQTITVTSDMAFTAIWNVNQYTVTFENDGGVPIYPAQTVDYNGTASNPGSPEKEHYTFDGWYLNDAPYDFGTPVTANITLTAHWTINKYTVTFDSAGGSSVDPMTVDALTSIERPSTSRSNYSFDGWFADAISVGGAGDSYRVTGDVTLTAYWTYTGGSVDPSDRYTVTFVPDNGEEEFNYYNVNEGTKVSAPEDPVWAGHIFDGWFTEDGVLFDFDTPITSDLTLTAKWRTTANVVIDDSEGGSFTGIDGEVGIGDSIELPDASKEGSGLVGWDTDGDGEADAQPGDSVTIEDDTTLVPVWEDLPDDAQQDHVIIDADGGSSDFDEWFTEDGKLTLPDASKDGSELAGWDTDGDGAVDAQPGDVIDVEDGDTITAVWDRQKHTVTYDYGGSTATRTVSDGSRAPMPADPVREGFAFVGWLLDGEGYDFSAPVKADITLVAQWNEIVSIVIDDSAGGSFTPIDGEVVAGDTIRLPEATKDGQQLAGWDTDGDGSVDAQPGDLVQIDGDTTLTPIWEDIPEGTEQDRVVIEDSGNLGMDQWWTTDGTIPLPEPSKDGEVFLGWDTDGDGVADAQPGDTVEVTDGQTITGIWRPAEDVDVTIDAEDDVSISGDIPEDLKEGDTVVLPDASKEDQKLAGWDTDGDGAVDAQPGDEIVVDGDTTLVPIFEDLAEDDVQNTVQIDDGSGSGSTWWTENDESMTVPEAPSRDGQVFEGWVDSDGNVYQPGDVIVPEGDMTLTAKWYDAPADDSDGPSVWYLVGAVAFAIVAGVLAVVYYKEIREWYVLVGMIVAILAAIVLALFYGGVL